MPKTCSYQLPDNESYRCPHLCHRNGKTCIFHDPNPKKDTDAFWNALNVYMKKVEVNEKAEEYDFRGFVFPAMWYKNSELSFYKKEFEKVTEFEWAEFLGSANFDAAKFFYAVGFENVIFSKGADFSSAEFFGGVSFSSAEFLGSADFSSAEFFGGIYFENVFFQDFAMFASVTFSGTPDFKSTIFSGKAEFFFSKFLEGVNFQKVKFLRDADFSFVVFSQYSDFSSAEFSEYADFGSVTFEQRAWFKDVEFHGEVFFKDAEIGFLKYFDASKANFEGVVLESAQFWGIDMLENYYFKDAMLLGLSLAGKKLVNCDFTGAVFAGCHIRAEDFDEATCRNTKYIYTEYEIGDSGAEDFPTPKEFGNIREAEDKNPKPKYSPKASSRVPAEGNFGDEGNPVSVAAYFHEPYKWNYALPLPREVRTSFMNYLHFFADYVKATQDLQVQLSQYPEGKKVRLVLQIEDAALRPMVEATLGEYLANLAKPFPEVEVAFRDHEMSDFDKRVLLTDYQTIHATTQANLALRYKTLEDAKRKEMEMSFGIMTHSQKVADRLLDICEIQAKSLNQMNPQPIQITNTNTNTNTNTSTNTNSTHVEIFLELRDELSALKHHLKHIRIEDEPDEVPEQVTTLQSDIEEAQKVLASTETPAEEKKGKVQQLLGGFFKAIKNGGKEIVYKGIPYIVTNHKAIGEIYDGIEKNINLLP